MPSQPLTPAAFVAKYKRTKLSERAISQSHFNDLCDLLGVPKPTDVDSTGDEYTFEKGITINIPGGLNLRGESGFADVWWNGKFGWEYKRQGKYKSLDEAYAQLQRYREALNNPPLLIVSDITTTKIHTNFNNAANVTHTVTLDDIEKGPGLDLLRRAFTDPESFRPSQTAEQVTQKVATDIGKIAIRLQNERHDPHAIAHFLMKCMFCLFAEDVPGLLPGKLFKKLLAENYRDPPRFTALAQTLFQTMATGGNFGLDQIPYFNGGLFDDKPPIKLSSDDLGTLNLAANQDWSQIEPSILGTLFERSLDPSKRAQIGAHYTSKEDILLVITPVIIDPLRKQWQKLKSQIQSQLAPPGAPDENPGPPVPAVKTSRSGKTTTTLNPLTPIHQQLSQFLANLSSLKILDPACGSGNFLYLAIQQLLSLEKEIITFAAQPPISLRLQPRVRPTQLLGLEINPYAAELAQVSIWIGFLQWLHQNGFPVSADTPILSKLKSIDNRDAILDFSTEPQTPKAQGLQSLALPAPWPDAHFIIGNPPFLGSKVFRQNGLPDDYIAALYKAYDLPKTSDLCCYWFELARQKIERGIGVPPMSPSAAAAAPALPPSPATKPRKPNTKNPSSKPLAGAPHGHAVPAAQSQPTPPIFPDLSLPRIGLLATQAIRGGDNRTVLQRIKKSGDIFMAWSDKEWILDGAMVHVSIAAFDSGHDHLRFLNGTQVANINSDLSTNVDLTEAKKIAENLDIAFMGDTKGGPFDIEIMQARKLLATPNPNGRPNLEVMHPWINGGDLTQRGRGMWMIDFGCDMPLNEAAQFEGPFNHVEKHVKPERMKNRRETYAERWWIHVEPRPAMRDATSGLKRFLVTTRVSKHRLFRWFENPTLIDSATFCFSRSDDYFMGILHNSIHELWSKKTGTQLREEESGERYTPSTCFETFPLPWPPGKEPNTPAFSEKIRVHPCASAAIHVELHARIAAAAKELNDLRERWLNPPELLGPLAKILDSADDFSDVPPEARPLIRHSALMAIAAQSPNLKKRTLTNLYNERPTWLKLAHEKLDRAILAAYALIDPTGGWSEDWAALYTETGAGSPLPTDRPQHTERLATDQKILTNLLRLNHQRARLTVDHNSMKH